MNASKTSQMSFLSLRSQLARLLHEQYAGRQQSAALAEQVRELQAAVAAAEAVRKRQTKEI